MENIVYVLGSFYQGRLLRSIVGSSGVVNQASRTIVVNAPHGIAITDVVETFTTTGTEV